MSILLCYPTHVLCTAQGVNRLNTSLVMSRAPAPPLDPDCFQPDWRRQPNSAIFGRFCTSEGVNISMVVLLALNALTNVVLPDNAGCWYGSCGGLFCNAPVEPKQALGAVMISQWSLDFCGDDENLFDVYHTYIKRQFFMRTISKCYHEKPKGY